MAAVCNNGTNSKVGENGTFSIFGFRFGMGGLGLEAKEHLTSVCHF